MSSDLVVRSSANGVTTLRMNNPRRLNGWTAPMMDAVKAALRDAAAEEGCKAVVLTGTDPYYSAGVNLGGTLRMAHPKKLHAMIVEHNQQLFEAFLNFDKPILAAVNGPAIGAVVTSATLCDGIVCSDKATFSTPFAALGVAAEGCSSVHFERIMGAGNARRMLGPEGFKPTGEQAAEIGLVDEVVPHDQLMDRAQAIAEGWVQAGRERTFRGGSERDELLEVNARESVQVADSFLARPFLKGQFEFLWKKKKRGPALMFLSLYLTQPAWSRLQ